MKSADLIWIGNTFYPREIFYTAIVFGLCLPLIVIGLLQIKLWLVSRLLRSLRRIGRLR
jgi:hypothetical protein